MSARHVKNLILGAGAMGSATAYHLARRGEPVALVEQFALDHDRGSSHGLARIIRHSYADPEYARLMLQAYQGWRDLEADAGRTLYLRSGGVSVSPGSVDYVAQVASSLASIGVPHRRMSGREWNAVSPQFGVRPTDEVVFEPDAGVLLAASAISSQIELARRGGAEILEKTLVRRIDLEADRPTVLLDEFELVADRLIVTAGAWTTGLLAHPGSDSPSYPPASAVLPLGRAVRVRDRPPPGLHF